MELCDFCSAERPAWVLPARSFDSLAARGARSVLDWLACDACAALVAAGDWDGLAVRGLQNPSAALLVRIGGEAYALRRVRVLHAEFRAHRAGPPRHRKPN